ncbi:MAG: hypothetical protein AAF363_04170 [Bacteroidota bacterium]
MTEAEKKKKLKELEDKIKAEKSKEEDSEKPESSLKDLGDFDLKQNLGAC